ncbi:MAG: hypothetical protein M0036_01355 [Desulfobacteraceae bacterium]|nr:hypothetical protein [Desulfobacteraceae bacterium]
MAASTREFYLELYAEHLEEASFLYEQRGALLRDAEVSWLAIDEVEKRLEAHLDALVIGQELALAICSARAVKGDFGELNAAVCVFCRQRRLDLIEQLWEHLDLEDKDRMLAVRNALALEWPEAWTSEIGRLAETQPQPCLALLPRVIGFRRLPAAPYLIHALPNCPEESLYPLLWALGRLRSRDSIPMLRKKLSHDNEMLRASAALGLLRMGELPFQQGSTSKDLPDFSRLLQIMLSGTPHDTDLILAGLKQSEGQAALVYALGVLGDIRAIGPLISLLAEEETAESAASALNLITGAELYEEVQPPEEISEDELSDEELQKYKNGQAPYASDAEPVRTVARLAQDPGPWTQWWHHNAARFRPGVRYRMGRPFSALGLVADLCHAKAPFFVRRLSYEELVVRYGVDIPFEISMRVKDQVKAIDLLKERVSSRKESWKEGAWYFAGRQIS